MRAGTRPVGTCAATLELGPSPTLKRSYEFSNECKNEESNKGNGIFRRILRLYRRLEFIRMNLGVMSTDPCHGRDPELVLDALLELGRLEKGFGCLQSALSVVQLALAIDDSEFAKMWSK